MSYQSFQDLSSSLPERPFLPYYIWETDQPRAIIHIVHGMSENALRYAEMAEWFTKHHLLVVAHDHIGHGPLAKAHNRLGYFGTNQAGEALSTDLKTVIIHMKTKYPDLPYFVVAHSMGAYVTRMFLDKNSDLIDGVCLSGTNANSLMYQFNSLIAPVFSVIRPAQHNYRLHRALFGSGLINNKKDLPLCWYKPQNGGDHDWPLCGFVFTNNGFAEVAKMANQATRSDWFKNIRRDLPLLFMNGLNDPLNHKGKDLEKLAKELKQHDFKNVTFQLYEHRGHEIFLYAGTEIVFNDLLAWIGKQVSQPKN